MTAPSTARPRVKTPAQIKAAKNDELIRTAKGKGWQVIVEVANQNDTIRLLTAAAKRVGLNVQTNAWSNGKTVTFKVTQKH